MSVSIRLKALIRIDSQAFRKHTSVRNACQDADVSLPPETAEFFDTDDEDREMTEEGVYVSLYDVVEGDVMYGDGAMLDIKLLPEGTTHISISCSH